MSPFHQNLNFTGGVYFLKTRNRTFKQFLKLFHEYDIEAGGDIRSFPTSRFPTFQRVPLCIAADQKEMPSSMGGKRIGAKKVAGDHIIEPERIWVPKKGLEEGKER